MLSKSTLAFLLGGIVSDSTTTTTPQPTRLPNAPKTCTDYQIEGYKCVPNNDCEGTFSIRSEGLDYGVA